MIVIPRSEKRQKERKEVPEFPALPPSGLETRAVNGVSLTAFFLVLTATVVLAIALGLWGAHPGWVVLVSVAGLLAALYFLFAIKVANQWEKAVVLRFGKFTGLRGPGLFWIVPIVDTIPVWIDHRVMVTPFNAEKTLTKDTVPVDVDAVLFWLVWDAEKAALEVEDYKLAISWAAQTALREIIGQMDLADILVGRARMDAELQKIIDERTTPWGITVQSVDNRWTRQIPQTALPKATPATLWQTSPPAAALGARSPALLAS